jgi:pyridoxal phosphate enzyme (YggS family)
MKSNIVASLVLLPDSLEPETVTTQRIEYATMLGSTHSAHIMTIQHNLSEVRGRIQTACVAAGRSIDTVQLLAVSKTQSLTAIQTAIDAGQCHFGENYLQEALEKILAFPQATWHFIGGIQSNKAKEIATHFDYVHSVSSLRVARRLNTFRPQHSGKLKVFLQVNLAAEASKGGVSRNELTDLVGETTQLPQLDLQGLMAIPPASLTGAALNDYFAQLIDLQVGLESIAGARLSQSSFGMSRDLEAAILAGSTWVRIGTAIFGARRVQAAPNMSETQNTEQTKESSRYG